MKLTDDTPPSIWHFGMVASAPKATPGTTQRWNTPGHRHCMTTTVHGTTRTWISREPSWDWIETTEWLHPTIKENRR